MMEPLKVMSDPLVEDASLVHNMDRSLTYNEVNMTVTVSRDNEDNISYPSESSSDTPATPLPATPTGEGLKPSGSPIMRGLQNVLNMFRSSQSPIVAGQNQEEISTSEIETSRASGLESEYPVVASTPVHNPRKDDSSSKRSSPLKDSIIFNEELSNELQWNNDSTILFGKERMPMHKLFLPQIPTTSSSIDSSNSKTDEPTPHMSTLNRNFNISLEPMDISYNESVNYQNGVQNNELSIVNNNIDNTTLQTDTNIDNNLNKSIEPMDVSYNESIINKSSEHRRNDISFSETRFLNETNNNSVFLDCESSLYDIHNETELLKSFNNSVNTYISPLSQENVSKVVEEESNNKNVNSDTKIEKSQSIIDNGNNYQINEIQVVERTIDQENAYDSLEIFLDATTDPDSNEFEKTFVNECNVSETNSQSNTTIPTGNISCINFVKELHDTVSEEINDIIKVAEAEVEAKVIQDKSLNKSLNQNQISETILIKDCSSEIKLNELSAVNNDNEVIISSYNDLEYNHNNSIPRTTEPFNIHAQIEEGNIEIQFNESNATHQVELTNIQNDKTMSYPGEVLSSDITITYEGNDKENMVTDEETGIIFSDSNVVNSNVEKNDENILEICSNKNKIFKIISNEEKIESINGKNIKVDYETLTLTKECDIGIVNNINLNIDQTSAMLPENCKDIKIKENIIDENNKNDVENILNPENCNTNDFRNNCDEKVFDQTSALYPENCTNNTKTKLAYEENVMLENNVNNIGENISNNENFSVYNFTNNYDEKVFTLESVENNKIINNECNEIFVTDVGLLLNDTPIRKENVNVDAEIVNLTNGQCHENRTNTSNESELLLNKMSKTIHDNVNVDLQTENLRNDRSDICNDINNQNLNVCMNGTYYINQNDLTTIDDSCNKNEIECDTINIESFKNPFDTKAKLVMSPPTTPTQKGNINNFNFVDIQNPFATKSKIQLSPPPTPNMFNDKTIDLHSKAISINNEEAIRIYSKTDDGVKEHMDTENSKSISNNVEMDCTEVAVSKTNEKLQNHEFSSSLEQSVYISLSEEEMVTKIYNDKKDVIIPHKEVKTTNMNITNDLTDNKLTNLENGEETEHFSTNINIGSLELNKNEGNECFSDVNTEDEDTLEGPFLDDNDFIDLVSENEIKIDNVFNDVNQPHYENMEPEEMFIDAASYDFLMNKNGNTISDNGKESLFLKFDPLCAVKNTSEGIVEALLINTGKQNIPNEDIPVLEKMHSDNEINYDAASEESFDELNVTVAQKPTMAVMPAVNNDAAGRQQVTPTRPSRQSFGSPAIALIDRLLIMSANNTPVRNNRTRTLESNYEQEEANKALTELRLLLTSREQDIENLRSESYELKSKLTSLENQMNNLETINRDKLTKINELNDKLESTTKKNKNMVNVVEEFERTIASLMSELEQEKKQHAEERVRLINERDEQTAHLASMEVSFSDLHSKYEKSKQVILGFKANEDSYKKSLSQFEENLQKMQNTYELLKQHATGKLNRANEELEKINRTHESEVLKMNTMIKRKELHITSLEETLNQKVKANEELTAICDELINKVG